MRVWKITIYDDNNGEIFEWVYGIYATKMRAVQELTEQGFDHAIFTQTASGIPLVSMKRGEDGETAEIISVKVIE